MKLRVLICDTNIFGTIGGGQTVYSNFCRRYPNIHFTFFCHERIDPLLLPPNSRAVPLTDVYRQQINNGIWPALELDLKGLSLGGKTFEFLSMMDFAASVAGESFDIVEIPDYKPFSGLIISALRYFGCKVGKVVLALHGTVSDALTDNWAPVLDGPDLRILNTMEMLNYLAADTRYGISRPYLREWKIKSGREGEYLDPQEVLNFESFAEIRASAIKKAQREAALRKYEEPGVEIVFVGRQEKWKGPDLFVDIVASLPQGIYERAVIIGPEVTIGGVVSKNHIESMARLRGLNVEFRCFPRQYLFEHLTSLRAVIVLPSRKDTFNLAALEALLCGVPVLVSSMAGVADYLPEAFPGLAVETFDPTNSPAAVGAISSLIDDLDRRRGQILTYLDDHAPKRLGSDLVSIYASQGNADPEARAVLDGLFVQFVSFIHIHLHNVVIEGARSGLKTALESMFGNENSALQAQLIDTFNQTMTLESILIEENLHDLPAPYLSDEQMERLHRKVAPMPYSGNRIPLYRILAKLEQSRGNNALYATYALRCMRLSGRFDGEELEAVCKALKAAGFHKEALAAEMMYGTTSDFDRIYSYLDSLRDRFAVAPDDDTQLMMDGRRNLTPRVSIIVSLYNAASKLPRFLDGLRGLTSSTHSFLEVIFVDSASPDKTVEYFRSGLRLEKECGEPFDILYIRTNQRETIQKAWNRGIKAARGSYLAFLGVDEMNRADAFDIMTKFLDRNPGVDWIQGTAIVTDVNSSGSFVRDVMKYERNFDNYFLNVFDTCYLGYVGALYRKDIHERVGYYDESFRAAGDTEFKNRAMPFINAKAISECLGTFLNYPDERTTQSPTAELEDLRAWYLYRTTAGVAYLFKNSTEQELSSMFWKTIGYKKTYMPIDCTDFELARSISEYERCFSNPGALRINFGFSAIPDFVLQIYRGLDDLKGVAGNFAGLPFINEVSGLVQRAGFAIANLSPLLKYAPKIPNITFNNDNRSHQHHYLWPSKSLTVRPESPLLVSDFAGPQDFGELLSSCQSTDPRVDFESAWASGKTEQLQSLFKETTLDIVVELTPRDAKKAQELTRCDALVHGRHSFLVLGLTPEEASTEPQARLYFSGDVKTPRPALAAASVALIVRDSYSEAIGVSRLLRAIMMGCSVVVDPDVAADAARLIPDQDWSFLAIARDCEAMITSAVDIMSGGERRKSYDHAIGNIRAALLAREFSVTPPMGFADGVPISKASLAKAFVASRALREAYKQGGIENLLAMAVDSDAITRQVACALLIDRDAPALKTRQPIFKNLEKEGAKLKSGDLSKLELVRSRLNA